MYAIAYGTLDDETIKLAALSPGDKLFAFFRGFYGLKVLKNIFTQQMSPFFKDLIRQGSELVCFDDILLMSNSKPYTMQLIEHIHDDANERNLNLALEKSFFKLLTLKYLGHEFGFKAIKPIESKMLQIIKFVLWLQKWNSWGSLDKRTLFLLKLMINFKLTGSLCFIYFTIKFDSTGLLNYKPCLNKLKHQSQNILLWHYPIQIIHSFFTVDSSLVVIGRVLVQLKNRRKVDFIQFSYVFSQFLKKTLLFIVN